MKQKILFILLLFIGINLNAQVKDLVVETYYIADQNDIKFPDFGELPLGATTYRIFVELEPGSTLVQMYGDANHPIKFASTESVFNNSETGSNFGYDIVRGDMKANTTALDSWLTLGQVARNTSTDVQFGVLKERDINGVSGGLGIHTNTNNILKNNVSSMGLPLTVADGLLPSTLRPTNWLFTGFVDNVSGEELTIFGIGKNTKEFSSKQLVLRNNGVKGVDAEKNTILLGQITTKGQISFDINLEVKDKNGVSKKYVATNSTIAANEVYSSVLRYPKICGCKDSSFVEYKSEAVCEDKTKCKNKIVFGCMDSLACNYNRSANVNIDALCCYIGYCNDEDLEVVCPTIKARQGTGQLFMDIMPNPVINELNFEHNIEINNYAKVQIFDITGRLRREWKLRDIKGVGIDLQYLNQGSYLLKVSNKQESVSKYFIKI